MQVAQQRNARRVNSRDVAQSENQDRWRPTQLTKRLLKSLSRAEEKRSVDFEHLDAARHGPQSNRVRIGSFRQIDQLPSHDLHIRDLGHALHEQEGGQHHADLQRDGEIDGDGQNERAQQHHYVGPRRPQMRLKTAPLRHMIGDEHQDARQGGQGDQRGPLADEKGNEQQHDRVNHAGDRCAAAALDVGGRTRDGTRGRDATEHRRHHVRDALCDQFHV